MVDFSKVVIERIVVHNVGSKNDEEIVNLSESELILDDAVKEVLAKYFLSPFKTFEYYNFFHEEVIENNKAYNCADSIFENQDSVFEQSILLAEHLFESSLHPNIKGGEFYTVYMKDCVIEGELVDAIGLFKSENKDTYLKVFPQGNNFSINCDDGININKLDKGCIIYNTEKENGYTVSIIDKVSKGNEAVFWKDEFLGLTPRKDSYFNTNQYIELCKDFCKDVLVEENNVPKRDQIQILKNSESYFKENENFDKDEYQEKVIQDPQIIEAFNEYKAGFEEMHDVTTEDNFEISKDMTKKSGKYFRSVLKLDKNFHVYVHSRPEFMEKGYDDNKGMNYYKLFFIREE